MSVSIGWDHFFAELRQTVGMKQEVELMEKQHLRELMDHQSVGESR